MKIVPWLAAAIVLTAAPPSHAERRLSKGDALRMSLRGDRGDGPPPALVIPRGWAPSRRREEFDRIVRHLPAILHNTELDAMLRARNVNALALVLSIIKQESNMDPEAVSRVGAVGFMQLMPRTFQEVYNGRYHRYFDPKAPRRIDSKTPPEIKRRIMTGVWPNLTAGVLYFRSKLEDFWSKERTVDRALAAYNAGAGTVAAYLRGRKPLPNETVDYVKKINRYYDELMAANPHYGPRQPPIGDEQLERMLEEDRGVMPSIPDYAEVEFINLDQCSLEEAEDCRAPKLRLPSISVPVEFFNLDQCSLPGADCARPPRKKP